MQNVSCLHPKKIVGLLSFTFIMNNYSYRLLSRCNKQLGSHLSLATRGHPRPDKDGDRALVTEDEKSDVVRLQSVSWSLAEFRHNKIVQSPHENYFKVCRQHKEK